MYICGNHDREIAYEGKFCPACTEIDTHLDEAVKLIELIGRLQDKIKRLSRRA